MAPDFETAPSRHNVARFFVENRHVSWVLFAAVLAWGIWAYQVMPERKDPNLPVRQVAVITPWPGQSAERVEQLVTRKIEEKIAQNMAQAELDFDRVSNLWEQESITNLDGLTPGQRIVVSGANLLRPGEAVREVN
jgi:AcrB/AcrD/AcrF family